MLWKETSYIGIILLITNIAIPLISVYFFKMFKSKTDVFEDYVTSILVYGGVDLCVLVVFLIYKDGIDMKFTSWKLLAIFLNMVDEKTAGIFEKSGLRLIVEMLYTSGYTLVIYKLWQLLSILLENRSRSMIENIKKRHTNKEEIKNIDKSKEKILAIKRLCSIKALNEYNGGMMMIINLWNLIFLLISGLLLVAFTPKVTLNIVFYILSYILSNFIWFTFQPKQDIKKLVNAFNELPVPIKLLAVWEILFVFVIFKSGKYYGFAIIGWIIDEAVFMLAEVSGTKTKLKQI